MSNNRKTVAVAATEKSLLWRRQGQRYHCSTITALCLLLLLVVDENNSFAIAAAAKDTEIDIDVEMGTACVDADAKNCPFWAATGECDTNKDFMHVNCKQSCNRCK